MPKEVHMMYYGYGMNPGYGSYGCAQTSNNRGYGYALILVLFILLAQLEPVDLIIVIIVWHINHLKIFLLLF